MHSKDKLNHTNQLAFRARIYERYRSSRNSLISVDDRANRAPYIQYLILKHFPPNRDAKILDLGCGSGTLLYFLQEVGYQNAFGVDVSEEQVASAQQLNIDCVSKGNLFDVIRKTDNNVLDVVVAFDVIEHMAKGELLEFGDEVHRVLRGGGRWIIHAPNAGSLFGSRIRYADLTHEQAFTRESLEQLLRAVGFDRIHCYEDQPIIHGLKSFLRWLVWKIARGVLRLYWAAETGSAGRECIFSQNFLVIAIK